MADTEEQELTIYVDGEKFTIDTMTFRERREVRRIAVEISEEDGDEYNVDDGVLAMIAVLKRRKDPAFKPEALLDEVPEAYLVPPPTPNGAKARRAKPKS